ncbi:MAG: cupin domain-containing protein [Myxococcota bacterium]
MSGRTVEELITTLGLARHPEGGYFRETWRSELELPASALPDHPGARSAGTSILYLLPAGRISALHRVRSDELWLFQMGDPLRLRLGPERDPLEEYVLGPRPGDRLQVLVPAGWWQTAAPIDGPAGYTLVGCVVVPGFDFADFEMADQG